MFRMSRVALGSATESHAARRCPKEVTAQLELDVPRVRYIKRQMLSWYEPRHVLKYSFRFQSCHLVFLQ